LILLPGITPLGRPNLPGSEAWEFMADRLTQDLLLQKLVFFVIAAVLKQALLFGRFEGS
jgi:hypothetical protein